MSLKFSPSPVKIPLFLIFLVISHHHCLTTAIRKNLDMEDFPAVTAFLGPDVGRSPEVILNGDRTIAFPLDKLEELFKCLCDKNYVDCAVLYTHDISLGDLGIFNVTDIMPVFADQPENGHTVSYKCHRFVSATVGEFPCDKVKVSKNPLISVKNVPDSFKQVCDFQCISLKWSWAAVYKDFGVGPTSGEGGFCAYANQPDGKDSGDDGKDGVVDNNDTTKNMKRDENGDISGDEDNRNIVDKDNEMKKSHYSVNTNVDGSDDSGPKHNEFGSGSETKPTESKQESDLDEPIVILLSVGLALSLLLNIIFCILCFSRRHGKRQKNEKHERIVKMSKDWRGRVGETRGVENLIYQGNTTVPGRIHSQPIDSKVVRGCAPSVKVAGKSGAGGGASVTEQPPNAPTRQGGFNGLRLTNNTFGNPGTSGGRSLNVYYTKAFEDLGEPTASVVIDSHSDPFNSGDYVSTGSPTDTSGFAYPHRPRLDTPREDDMDERLDSPVDSPLYDVPRGETFEGGEDQGESADFNPSNGSHANPTVARRQGPPKPPRSFVRRSGADRFSGDIGSDIDTTTEEHYIVPSADSQQPEHLYADVI
ncbi:hypothetical protein PoB_003444500 [Plakobranchus ocellatus]|uniref:Uncharacterized protein n=1 Tax=Plakobranchus ocellatus TaxID=259542 RepID=A0AAV4AKQ2_9GAST|nr:hypothetical protein PoB_003444500 [Plakobranchus ocellatus]